MAIKIAAPLIASALMWLTASANAGDIPELSLVIKNHAFQPGDLKAPADKKFKIRISNQDATPEEFESTDFNRESIVLPGKSIVVFVGPLRPGTYGFFGDFHRDSAHGRIIVE